MDENDYRIVHEGPGEVQFQLHQSKEIALEESGLRKSPFASLTLKAGHEYHIEILPHGEISTTAFKKLSFMQRKCHLENEVFEDSIFKTYTAKNCKYECHVKVAGEICSCIPWDFIHNTNKEECDVFGRTCFHNAINNVTKLNTDCCRHS